MRRPLSNKKHALRAIIFVFALFCCLDFRSCISQDRFRLPFGLHFAKDYILLEPGDRYPLKINGIHLAATYHSSSSKTASVTQSGVVYAWKCGQAVITATIHNRDNKKIHCIVHVTKLNYDTLKLSPGQKKTLRILGVYFGVSYQSGNPRIASVNRFGRVKAVSRGTTAITASAKGKTFRCTVTVE